MSESILTICLVNIVTVLLGILTASLLAFGKRSAENIAMNANFQNMLEQLKAQTAATENIKAAINDGVWESQRHFEMRRDVVFDAIRVQGELDYAFIDLRSALLTPIPEREDLIVDAIRKRLEKAKNFESCNAKFYRAMRLTEMVVGETLSNALYEWCRDIRLSVNDLTDKNVTASNITIESLAQKSEAVKFAARKELKLEIAE
jgi:hypothetical protein